MTSLPWPAIFTGMTLGYSLILPIGPQNAYVLRMGARGQHVFLVATTCSLADTLLISLGVFGVGQYIAQTGFLRLALGSAGILFLLTYGTLSLRSAWRSTSQVISEDSAGNTSAPTHTPAQSSWPTVLMITLSFSLLNPHAILDTVVLMGGYAAQFPTDAERAGFAVGAIGASVIFFYSLAYSAQALSPILQQPAFSRGLDLCVGLLMYLIAYKLATQIL